MSNINPYYYPFKEAGYPDKLRYVNLPSGLNVYLLCDSKDKREIFVHNERLELRSNKKETKNASLLFLNLALRLKNCEYITQVFDIYGDQLHIAFSHIINSNKINIYRLRNGCVRLYFVIVESNMILFRLSLKKEDSISNSERKMITDRVEAIYKAPPNENQYLRRVIL